MTIVCAVKDKENKNIILGADTMGTVGQLKVNSMGKIIEVKIPIIDGYGEIITEKSLWIGSSGYAFITRYIDEVFTVPFMDSQETILEYLYQEFLPELRINLIDKNLVEVDNGVLDSNMSMLFIYEDKIFRVNSSFSVDIVTEDYSCTGSGWEVALGSIYTNLTWNPKLDKEEVVKQAVKTAGANTIYCNEEVALQVIPYIEES